MFIKQFQEQLILLLSKLKLMATQIILVNFRSNHFLHHQALILLLKPFVIKLNFKVLLEEEIIIRFTHLISIGPYSVTSHFHVLKIQAFIINRSFKFQLELEDLVAPLFLLHLKLLGKMRIMHLLQ